MESFKYQPMSVREALTKMKDLSELMVDLAYSAVLFHDREIAEEVNELEKRVDFLGYLLTMNAMLSVRDLEDAESVTPIVVVASAADKISDAAADIANIVKGVGLHPAVLDALQEVDERVTRARVSHDSTFVGKTLDELQLPLRVGATIIAIRRRGEWLCDPKDDAEIQADDMLIAYGSRTGTMAFKELVEGKIEPSLEAVEIVKPSSGLDLTRRGLVELKDTSELMVDLAYSALLFNNRQMAQEVSRLEDHVDKLHITYELSVLSNISSADAYKFLGMLHLGVASENIADAAMQMVGVVLQGLEPHPVLKLALDVSEETMARERVAKASMLDGRTLGEIRLYDNTGMWVIAIRRGDGWIYSPDGETRIEADDILIVRGDPDGRGPLKSFAQQPSQKRRKT